MLLYMYSAEIGRKINSKTICRIKNLFVTTYVSVYYTTHIYVFPPAPPRRPVRFLIKFVYKNTGESEK